MVAAASAAVVSESTDRSSVDDIVAAVAGKKAAWRDLSARDKLGYLLKLRDLVDAHGREWAANSARIRGVRAGGPTPHLEGGGWLASVAVFASSLSGFIRTFRGLAETGSVPEPPGNRTRPDGQKIFTTFPTSGIDKVVGAGTRGEIWLEPGAEGTQGKRYRESHGGLSVILGAGNYEGPIDILSKMFGQNEVVIYKPNPVNASNAEHLRKVLAPLIEDGYLAIVDGGADVGQALLAHDEVDDVLMTGSAATYDRIVWGPPAEQAANKQSGNKLMKKPFEAELGGCAPVIVVPGQWTDEELDHQAAHIAASKVMNGSHICASPQVLVIDRAWPQRKQFLDRIRHHLAAAPNDGSYYPGGADNQKRFQEAYEQSETIEPSTKHLENQLPRLLISDVPKDSLATKQEAFCPVLAEVLLDGGDAKDFLEAAVEYCNEQLFGSLSATLLVDPRTSDAIGGVDDAVARLRYGSIGVNIWGAWPVFFGDLSWGAHPGHTPEDIQSGMGIINNAYMLDGVQKCVFWTPFVHAGHPKPQTPRDKIVGERLSRLLTNPSPIRLIKLISGAALGL